MDESAPSRYPSLCSQAEARPGGRGRSECSMGGKKVAVTGWTHSSSTRPRSPRRYPMRSDDDLVAARGGRAGNTGDGSPAAEQVVLEVVKPSTRCGTRSLPILAPLNANGWAVPWRWRVRQRRHHKRVRESTAREIKASGRDSPTCSGCGREWRIALTSTGKRVLMGSIGRSRVPQTQRQRAGGTRRRW